MCKAPLVKATPAMASAYESFTLTSSINDAGGEAWACAMMDTYSCSKDGKIWRHRIGTNTARNSSLLESLPAKCKFSVGNIGCRAEIVAAP